MLSVDEALARVLEISSARAPERCSIEDALGRALAVDALAQRTLPPWDNSAMDGFAVVASDVGTPPVRLKILETVHAGSTPSCRVEPGTCARIMTGAPLPEGADAVVPIERTRTEGLSHEVEILEPAVAHAFVRARGEDTKEGDVLLPKGTVLGVPEAALLWAQAETTVLVPRRPHVAILSTGDELCPVDAPSPNRLVDTNGPALALFAKSLGAKVTRLGLVKDSLEEILSALGDVTRFDVVLTSAGVSMGERDFVKTALEQLGVENVFWKVAMKPGKPLWVGSKGGTVVFGLPGNPTSSLVSFELFVRPALAKMMGNPTPRWNWESGQLGETLNKPKGLTHFVRVTTRWEKGIRFATPLKTQSSGSLSSVAKASHLLVFPAEMTQLPAGAPVALLRTGWAGG